MLNTSISDANAIQFVDILGGIDIILQHCLSDASNLTINQSQLHQIKLLLQQPDTRTKHKIAPNKTNIETNHYHSGDVVYYFNESDTCLASLIGDYKANQLLNFVYSNAVRTIIALFFAYHASLVMFGEMKSISYFGNRLWIPCTVSLSLSLLVIPCFIAVLLSANDIAMWLILQSFEFWFKIANGITNAFGVIFIYYQGSSRAPSLDLLFVIATQVLVILAIFYMSSMDALRCIVDPTQFEKTKSKVLFSVVIAITYLMVCIDDMLKRYQNVNELYFVDIWFIRLSVQWMIVSSRRNLMIFFIKQALLAIVRRSEGKAVMIKPPPPVIQWNAIQNDQTCASNKKRSAAVDDTIDEETSISAHAHVPRSINVTVHNIKSQMEAKSAHYASNSDLDLELSQRL